jgi:hypothetical protein
MKTCNFLYALSVRIPLPRSGHPALKLSCGLHGTEYVRINVWNIGKTPNRLWDWPPQFVGQFLQRKAAGTMRDGNGASSTR